MKKIFNFQFSIFNFKSGFTVLESIVAIAVVSLAIAGAFSAVGTGLSSAIQAKEETKAYYLAQEALEIIRNKRDANILDKLINGAAVTWRSGISENASDPCFPGKTCKVDATGPGIPPVYLTECSASGNLWDVCPVLTQDPNTYLYSYSGSLATIFNREIQIENISNVVNGVPQITEIAVTIRISWQHAGMPKEFKTKTILTNWF